MKDISDTRVAPAQAASASVRQIAAWRSENGVPDKADDYVGALDLPQGVVPGEADKPLLASFAQTAHELPGDLPIDVRGDGVVALTQLTEVGVDRDGRQKQYPSDPTLHARAS